MEEHDAFGVNISRKLIDKFYSNSASDNGGALYGRDNCTIKIIERSTRTFNNNRTIGDGGAVYINTNSAIF